MARLAGLDRAVITRAKEIVTSLERGDDLVGARVPPSDQLSLLAIAPPQPARNERSAVERSIAETDLDGMSPREAHAFLAELQAKLK